MDGLGELLNAGTGAGAGAGAGAMWLLVKSELRNARASVAHLRSMLQAESRARRIEIQQLRGDVKTLMMFLAKHK